MRKKIAIRIIWDKGQNSNMDHILDNSVYEWQFLYLVIILRMCKKMFLFLRDTS